MNTEIQRLLRHSQNSLRGRDHAQKIMAIGECRDGTTL